MKTGRKSKKGGIKEKEAKLSRCDTCMYQFTKMNVIIFYYNSRSTIKKKENRTPGNFSFSRTISIILLIPQISLLFGELYINKIT